MRVEVIRGFGAYRTGQVLDPPDGVLTLWLRAGWVKPIDQLEEEPQPEAKDTKPAEDKMIRKAKKRKG